MTVSAVQTGPNYLTAFGGKLYFASGGTLWHTDGATAPVEVTRGVGGATSFASISSLTAGSGMLGVISRDGQNFITVVTAENASDVGKQVPVTDASNLTGWEYAVDQHALVYVVDNGATYSLQTTASTSAIMTGSASIIDNLTGAGGNLFFTVGGNTLYVSVGGAAAVRWRHTPMCLNI